MAAEYLQNTEMPIDEIIQKVGYSNGSFFRQLFNKYYQMSPKEFRRVSRNMDTCHLGCDSCGVADR